MQNIRKAFFGVSEISPHYDFPNLGDDAGIEASVAISRSWLESNLARPTSQFD